MTHPTSKSDDEDVGISGIIAFLVLTFAWSWGIWGPKVLLEQGLVEGVPVLPNLGAFGPTVAAFIPRRLREWVRRSARRLAGRAIQRDYLSGGFSSPCCSHRQSSVARSL